MASCAARHQSSGSCSAQPMWAEAMGAWSAEWEARTLACAVDEDGAGAAGADVDAEEHGEGS